MQEQDEDLGARLLQEWHYRRGMVNYYIDALQRPGSDGPDREHRRRVLQEQLFLAQLAYRHASDQLQSYEQEQAARETRKQQSRNWRDTI